MRKINFSFKHKRGNYNTMNSTVDIILLFCILFMSGLLKFEVLFKDNYLMFILMIVLND